MCSDSAAASPHSATSYSFRAPWPLRRLECLLTSRARPAEGTRMPQLGRASGVRWPGITVQLIRSADRNGGDRCERRCARSTTARCAKGERPVPCALPCVARGSATHGRRCRHRSIDRAPRLRGREAAPPRQRRARCDPTPWGPREDPGRADHDVETRGRWAIPDNGQPDGTRWRHGGCLATGRTAPRS